MYPTKLIGLYFYLCINHKNNLPDNLISNVKIFADDTSIYSIVNNPQSSANDLNSDLSKINQWAHEWKMSFNPDASKQAVEVLFSRKLLATFHPSITFNHSPVMLIPSHKHLGLILDEKLNFNNHLKEKISKANVGIGMIKRLSQTLPRKSLLSIYKCFVRSYLDYCDIIYDKPNNEIFKSKLESVQYNAALAITGAIRGTSMQKLLDELGLELLSERRWYRKLCFFFRIVKGMAPVYLNHIIQHHTPR